ncbi:Spo0B domain-containing protein [Paenibacillus terreus]|uniref:Spo0B domain-containing protein n=2 Tax=Paenibacillus terreus TaxID=1387834 RepID=A0ABV5BG08_9BACL
MKRLISHFKIQNGEKTMLSRKSLPLLAVCSVLAPLILALLVPGPVTVIILGVWGAAAATAGVEMTRRHAEKENAAMRRALEETANTAFNHHRHDWMNDLQVLYGYIRMGKHDKSAEYVERIKERAVQDSRISKLGIPALIFYLHSFRVNSHSLRLEVSVEDQLQLGAVMSPEDGESLALAVRDTVQAYQCGVGRSSWGEVRSLNLYFGMDQGDVIVRFEGSDLPADSEMLMQVRARLENQSLRMEQLPSGQTFQIRVPCQT